MKLQSLVLASLLSIGSVSAAEWGYDAENGPNKWGEHYKECGIGKEQSPINIITKDTKTTSNEFKATYKVDSKDIINNGHSVQVNFNQNGGIHYKGEEYKLVQLHFHTPSENKIDNKTYPLEMHLVHNNTKGQLLVVGVFFEEGKDNSELKNIVTNAPKKAGETKKLTNIDPAKLLPQAHAYYAFDGSLTTPPCSEKVQWIVLKNPISASKKQIDSLHNIMHNNARDVQPLNKRKILNAE